MMSPSPLRVEAVQKCYGGRTVLKAVSFSLLPGEMFGLVGLNGAGKTTLIKIILDLAVADKGGVTLFGLPAARIEARRHLSYLPEKFHPSRHLTGLEYLDLALSYYGKKLEVARAEHYAARLDLDPKALRMRVSAYSKGMGQKLGLAGAFLADAPLLLLDEPMSGLDPRARIALKETLLDSRSNGKTIFFSSHILSDIDEICDRIGVLHEGRLGFVGAPADFKALYGETSLEKAFLRSIEPPLPAPDAATNLKLMGASFPIPC